MSSRNDTLLMGNNLVSFEASVSRSLRDDILDCLLYAEHSANKKHDRSLHWKLWIEQYQRVLYQNGGRLTGAINADQLIIQHIRELRYVPYAIAGSATSRELQAVLERSISKLLDSSHARTFFNSWFSSGRSESFQVIPCCANEGGGVSILVCGLQMTSRAFKPGPVAWEAGGDLTIRSNGGSFLLSEESYQPYRERIRAHLARQARQAILEL
ncbi:hypothetical protein SAMN03159444_02528 [Pseudomonas sp. NFACC02]|uniref:hypothetical protein n=1 Tax=Pseudomonas TaxID=286 RepID=UPI0007816DE1|nr:MULTISPECIES: hypothetical protein [Pseudomonas]SEQ81738.1 hypothetical protein SAMN03159444_02528 [Pseudomonas sp. NFACC02]